MPTLLWWNGYRFYFFAAEGNEPPDIHVDKAEKATKVWLHNLQIAFNEGFTSKELNKIVAKIAEHREEFTKVWYDFFSGKY